jgi:adenylate cyclase
MVQGRDESVDASPMAGQIRKIEMDRARGRTAPGSKVPLEYTFLGEQEVKNTKNPVRPYQVKLKTDTALQRPSGTTSVVRPAISIIGILAVIIAAGTLFWFKPWNAIKDPDSTEPTLFNKPSIEVLPFHNLSDDPEQEHFSDGLTTDIITDLSKFSSLFVIAANSTFRYKGQAVNVQSVGEELGAHSARLSI